MVVKREVEKMDFTGKKMGFALTGSHCTISKVLPQMEKLVAAGAEVYPILSLAVSSTSTRFGPWEGWVARVKEITGREPITSIVGAEPLGPGRLLDALVIAPCTGNTLARLANAITDGPVTMAAKATLRNGRPLILGVATNDGLGLNAKNIGLLLAAKNIYFIPFGQDNPQEKPTSLEADFNLLVQTVAWALEGRQLQPLLVAR